jgi:exonuclease SbcD
LDAFALCNSFLKDLDANEQALLRDVINTVQEVQA